MKKVFLLFLAALLIFTTACSGGGGGTAPAYGSGDYPTDDTYHPETDNPYFLYNIESYNRVARSRDGYYFLLYGTLLYADADTMQPIPVCARPNCRHNEETDPVKKQECNAYFPVSVAGNVFVSNDQLYVFHKTFGLNINNEIKDMDDYALTAITPDGTQRTTVFEVESDFALMNMIHRGRFYIVTQSTNEQGFSTAELWSYSLDNPREEPKLLYQSEPLQQTSNIVMNLYAYGTRLYLREYLAVSDSGQERVLRIYDLTTNEWTVLENPEGYSMGSQAIADGQLIRAYSLPNASSAYNLGEELPDLSAPLTISQLDGSGESEIDFATWGAMTADESYIYMRSPNYYEAQADGTYVSSISTGSYYFYDPEMNLVDELHLEDIAVKDTQLVSCTLYPTQGEHILLYARYRRHMAFYYINRSEIGTGNITPVEFLNYTMDEYSFINN